MTLRRRVWITFGSILALSVVVAFVALPARLLPRIPFLHRQFDLKLGLDLRGGAALVYEADTSAIESADQAQALDSARDVIERRVNAFGVSEPVVQTSRVGDKWRVIVELAGVQDISQAIALIGDTPNLEFKEEDPTAQPDVAAQQAQTALDAAAKKQAENVLVLAKKPGADFAALANEHTSDPSNTDAATQEQRGGDLGYARRGTFVPEFDKALFDQLKNGEVTAAPVKTSFGYHLIKREESRTVKENGKDILEVRGRHILFAVQQANATTGQFKDTGLSGKQLDRASVTFNQSTGEPEVNLQFNGDGGKLFAEVTKRNIGKTIAIFLDGQIISNPTVNQEITGGTAVISGSFTLKDAKDLAKRLNAGALPVPIVLVNQQTVGATLGAESVERSIFAGLLGIVIVIIFMIAFYRLPGVVASLALILYTLIVLAIFKLWPVTLTLAGIAGFILSIGIALDANILIFERTKEELRSGRPLEAAIEEGFKRAWMSIRDSNASSIITSIILIWFGSSLIKGFAITLLIGIVVSLFSAITVTRTLLRLITGARYARHPRWFGL